MNPTASDVEDRLAACLSRQGRLTVGEVGLLNTLRGKKQAVLTMMEEMELRHIERKLGLAF